MIYYTFHIIYFYNTIYTSKYQHNQAAYTFNFINNKLKNIRNACNTKFTIFISDITVADMFINDD